MFALCGSRKIYHWKAKFCGQIRIAGQSPLIFSVLLPLCRAILHGKSLIVRFITEKSCLHRCGTTKLFPSKRWNNFKQLLIYFEIKDEEKLSLCWNWFFDIGNILLRLRVLGFESFFPSFLSPQPTICDVSVGSWESPQAFHSTFDREMYSELFMSDGIFNFNSLPATEMELKTFFSAVLCVTKIILKIVSLDEIFSCFSNDSEAEIVSPGKEFPGRISLNVQTLRTAN